VEIPRHWRQIQLLSYQLKGIKCEKGHMNFPPNKPVCIECGSKTETHPLANTIIYDSSLFLSPNDEVVHSEVVRKNQK
jgi:hypothetical protein